jgi:hypothetical protein
MNMAKKITSYFLIALVLIFTVVAILGIWNIVDIRDVLINFMQTLLVVFIAAAIVLFIFAVLIKENKPSN